MARGTLKIEKYLVTSKDKGVLLARDGARRVVIKLPFSRKALEAEIRNRSRIDAIGDGNLLIPRAISEGEISGIRFFVEEASDGSSLSSRSGTSLAPNLLASLSKALESLNPELGSSPIEPPTLQETDTEIATPLKALTRALDGKDSTRAASEILHGRLASLRARRGLVHGDFSANNIFILESRVTGIIDWEHSTWAIPALDAVNLLDSIHRMRQPGATISDTVLLLVTNAWPSRIEWDFLVEQCRRSGVGTDGIGDVAAYYWVRHVASQLSNNARYDIAVLKRRVAKFLDYVVRELHPALAAGR